MSQSNINDTDSQHIRLLQAVFSFDDNDLVANRYGKITPAQRYQLRDYYLKRQNDWLWLIIITTLGLWIGLPSLSTHQPLVGILALLIVFGADTLLVADMLYKRSDKALNLLDESLLEVSGTAVLSKDENSANTLLLFLAPTWYVLQSLTSKPQYKIRIGDQRFTVNSEAFQALKNGETYRVYFGRNKTPILSIEPISPAGGLRYLPNARPSMLELDYPTKKKKKIRE